MNDKENSRDQTDAVCAPIIRFGATLEGISEHGLTNGIGKANFDQTEPCAFVPIIRLQAEGENEPDANGKAPK